MNASIVCYNKRFYHDDEVPIRFNNRAFKFGDSFFETIRCNGNEALHFNLHYKRMIKALMSLKMEIASLPPQHELEHLISSLLKQNKCFGASRVRIEVLRSGMGLYTPETNNVDFVIECSKLVSTNYELNKKGLLLGDFTEVKKGYNPISFFKSGNALPYILASFEKVNCNVDDCFIYNNEGKIIEAISSNLFWIKDGVFYTSSVFSGCVGGIMRQVIIQIIKSSKWPNVIEVSGVQKEELVNVDEMFLCNAIQGVQWIVGYNDRRYFNQMTRQLQQLLNEFTYQSI
ncbi:aminotransferase class IV [Saccharicrinis aurantiacus]|uniref:aminotransferase class IV n=1 Tax=Saccharicrinis aurantiacus TaxID=1849719 RepID=UPI00248FA712|nr:aminotransferase class IV [Saccharicrinis aurantiacus]